MNYEIVYDEHGENPRECENATIMIFTHRRYGLPNETKFDFKSASSWDEAEKAVRRKLKNIRFFCRVYMMDHSVLTFSLKPFGGIYGYFDSGCVGFIAITGESIGDKKRRKQEEYEAIANAELKTYEAYANGEVYRVVIEDEEGEEVDSCSGFFGRESGEEWAKERIFELSR